MEFINKLKKWLKTFLMIAPSIVTIASVITAVTPNPVDDGVVAQIHQVLDILSLNVANNAQPAAGAVVTNN